MLTDFPVVMDLAKLPSAVRSWLYIDAQSGGEDIRLTTSDGTTTLNYERKNFAKAASTVTGEIYFKVPSVDNAAVTDLYLYAGNSGASDGENATGAWNADFLGVYHGEESGDHIGNDYLDSTSNANHMQGGSGIAGKTPTRVAGAIGYAQDYDGGDDHIKRTSGPLTTQTQNVTMEAYVNPDSSSDVGVVMTNGSPGFSGYSLYQQNGSGGAGAIYVVLLGGITYSVTGASGPSVTAGSYQHVAATRDTSTWRLYKNGVVHGTTGTTNPNTPASYAAIGGYGANGWDGKIDEVRFSNVERSAAWLKFTYNNIAASDNELQNFSLEENASTIPIFDHHYRMLRRA